MRQPGRWHDGVIRYVRHLAAADWQDHQILEASTAWTMPEFTREQTWREVKVAIDGAQRRGFDMPTQPTAPSTQPPLQRRFASCCADELLCASLLFLGRLSRSLYPLIMYIEFENSDFVRMTSALPPTPD